MTIDGYATTCPPIRIDGLDVVLGPWPEPRGNCTVLDVREVDAFIASLTTARDTAARGLRINAAIDALPGKD